MYILKSEILENKMFFSDGIVSAISVLTSKIAVNKNINLTSLKGIFVKPINSALYKLTNKFPLSIIIRLFYNSPILFISIFPVFTWLIFVKAV